MNWVAVFSIVVVWPTSTFGNCVVTSWAPAVNFEIKSSIFSTLVVYSGVSVVVVVVVVVVVSAPVVYWAVVPISAVYCAVVSTPVVYCAVVSTPVVYWDKISCVPVVYWVVLSVYWFVAVCKLLVISVDNGIFSKFW